MNNREILEQNNQELSNIKSSINILKVGDISDATAKAGDILNGKTAYISDGRVTGELIINEQNNSRLDNYAGGQIKQYFTEIPPINTSNATNMRYMFRDCENLIKIHELDTSNVVSMEGMFYGCHNLTTIPELDTSNLGDGVKEMFCGCDKITSVPHINTKNAISLEAMFRGCTSLLEIPALDTSNVTNMYSTFEGCQSITSIPAFNTSNVTNMHRCFFYCNKLVDLPILNTSKVTDMQEMFASCNSLSDESLNNILAMCANATSYTNTKTLKYIGLTSEQATKCTTLSNYSAFTSAGWTTGY